MIERIDRSESELDVALGIDVVENLERDIRQILNVYIPWPRDQMAFITLRAWPG
jgi:hypothetical protein